VLAFICGIAITVAILLHFYSGKAIWIIPLLGVGGLKVGLISLIVAAVAAYYARRVDQLRAGADRIARWTVDPQQWNASAELNERLNATVGHLPCRIGSKWQRGTEGVEFMAGRDSLLFGDEFHWLPARCADKVTAIGWLEGPPPCLEFNLTHYGKYITKYALRVPIAPGAESDAIRVLEHFHARIPPPLRMNFRRRRKIALICAAIFAISTAVFAVLPRDGSAEMRALLLVGIFASAIFCVTSLFIALVMHRWLKRSRQLERAAE
jgi:hypothetical protein